MGQQVGRRLARQCTPLSQQGRAAAEVTRQQMREVGTDCRPLTSVKMNKRLLQAALLLYVHSPYATRNVLQCASTMSARRSE